uniref:DUF148 domain-containing protein n=1 Tax=Panagrellus redivivus TaxID=6233 RepID=A0A7E4VNE8_PANRE
MQIRPLFAVLILGFAVGIALAETDDLLAELDEMTAEQLARLFVEGTKAWISETNAETQGIFKFMMASSIPDLPELLNNIELPVDQFLDLFLQAFLDSLKEKSPSKQAELQKKLNVLIRNYIDKIEHNLESE